MLKKQAKGSKRITVGEDKNSAASAVASTARASFKKACPASLSSM
jgi:hypothetical protein